MQIYRLGIDQYRFLMPILWADMQCSLNMTSSMPTDQCHEGSPSAGGSGESKKQGGDHKDHHGPISLKVRIPQ